MMADTAATGEAVGTTIAAVMETTMLIAEATNVVEAITLNLIICVEAMLQMIPQTTLVMTKAMLVVPHAQTTTATPTKPADTGPIRGRDLVAARVRLPTAASLDHQHLLESATSNKHLHSAMNGIELARRRLRENATSYSLLLSAMKRGIELPRQRLLESGTSDSHLLNAMNRQMELTQFAAHRTTQLRPND